MGLEDIDNLFKVLDWHKAEINKYIEKMDSLLMTLDSKVVKYYKERLLKFTDLNENVKI